MAISNSSILKMVQKKQIDSIEWHINQQSADKSKIVNHHHFYQQIE